MRTLIVSKKRKCKCGCGKLIKLNPARKAQYKFGGTPHYISGHNLSGGWNKRTDLAYSLLRKLYLEEKLSIVAIAKKLESSKNTVNKYLIRYGIPRRTPADWTSGRKHTPETIQKIVAAALKRPPTSTKHRKAISAGKIGKPNFKLRDRVRTKAHCNAISIAKKNQHLHCTEQQKQERRSTTIAYLKKKGFICPPTKPEQRVMQYIKDNDLPYTYVGNGKFWIEQANPDFVNTNGEKKVIEVDGCYWHNCPVCFPKKTGYTKNAARDQRKYATYNKYGWAVIRLWEHDINANRFVPLGGK